jgi:hypothetical protein
VTNAPTPDATIPKRQRDAIVAALRSGVVPRAGLQYLRVGRDREIKTLVDDVDRVASGGSTVRFIVGDFGSGKSFLLGLIRELALATKLVVASADLAPSRRLHSTSSQAQSLYTELMSSLSTKASPNGGAIEAILEQFVNACRQTARATGDPADGVIRHELESLLPFTGGYDFVEVVAAYWRGFDEGDAALSQAAVRWLRGEFATKTEARQALGVRTIVNDATYYDTLKMFARFCRLAGFGGLLVEIDELTILFRLSHPKGRESNYEKLLTIVNDALQGTSVGIGFLFAGTTETLTDQRRGMYSYKALRTRLPENPFADGGLVDFSGPVIRLGQLTANELYALLVNLRSVVAGGDPTKLLVPDDALLAFMDHCSAQVGDAYFRTPRDTVTAFLNFLAVLEQNRGTDWRAALGLVKVKTASVPGLDDIPDPDDGASAVGPTPSGPGEGDKLTNLRL